MPFVLGKADGSHLHSYLTGQAEVCSAPTTQVWLCWLHPSGGKVLVKEPKGNK